MANPTTTLTTTEADHSMMNRQSDVAMQGLEYLRLMEGDDHPKGKGKSVVGDGGD